MVGRSWQRDRRSASRRPHPDHKPVVSGLGAGAPRAVETEDLEFLCRSCSDQDAVFGMEDGIGEELKASDEEEEAVKVASQPSTFQPAISQLREHRVTHFPYSFWCPNVVEG